VASVVHSIEIGRSAEDVFAYVDQLDRHGEWQHEIVSARVETDGPIRVGTRATEVRKVPGGEREFTYEITAHDPPRLASFRGLNGPVRPVGTFTVEALGDGRSRATIDLTFEFHGFGNLLRPIVVRDARKRVPENQQRLKERLEAGA